MNRLNKKSLLLPGLVGSLYFRTFHFPDYLEIEIKHDIIKYFSDKVKFLFHKSVLSSKPIVYWKPTKGVF